MKGPEPPPWLGALHVSTWEPLDLLQVRAKALSAGAFERMVRAWVDRLAPLSVPVIVDDRLDVALAAGADGVHVGQRDLPVDVVRSVAPEGWIVGASTHDRDELVAARTGGADYAGLGAFFPSDTKMTARLLDPEAARVAKPLDDFDLPVLAIGGITSDRIDRAFEVPAVTGVAVSGAIQRADDVGAAIRELRSRIDAIWIERRGDR